MYLCANNHSMIYSGSDEKLSLDTRTSLERNKTASEVIRVDSCSIIVAEIKVG